MPSVFPPAFVRRHDRRRHGIVLIFVVAVLVLLAVIATTYLSMARIDRVSPEIRGGLTGGVNNNIDFPLDEILCDVFSPDPSAVNNDAFDADDATRAQKWRYRPAGGLTPELYHNSDYLDERGLFGVDQNAQNFIDRQAHDPWLASKVPTAFDGTNLVPNDGTGNYASAYPIWPKISRWMERWNNAAGQNGWVFTQNPDGSDNTIKRNGYFESPYSTTAGTPPTYHAFTYAIPTYIRIDYGSYKTPADYDQKTVVYPALQFPTGLSAETDGKVFLAADTDGDGVADAGLFPLNSWTTIVGGVAQTPGFFPDGPPIPAGFYPGDTNSHKRRWYAAVRVVDLNDAINVNTAWRRNADIGLPGATDDSFLASGGNYGMPSTTAPNFGFFRSNVGLYELLPGLNIAEWQRFSQTYRLNNRLTTSMGPTGRGDYVYTTLGEALEMGLARRPFSPANDASGTYGSFGQTVTTSLAYLNGLVNPREGRSTLESALYLDTYWNVPNFATSDVNTDADKESRSFTFFSAPSTLSTTPSIGTVGPSLATSSSPLFWWHSMYNPDDTTRNAFFSTGLGAYNGANPPPRPVRHWLTTFNPLSTSARDVEKAATGPTNPIQPTWLLAASSNAVMMPFFPQEGRRKASINTDPFEKLWRQFYLTMADPVNAASAPQYLTPAEAFPNANGRHSQAISNAQDLLYLRSAIAAVNAIDQRDGDDDITTYRITLPNSPGKTFVVAGAEQQAFISNVSIDTSGPNKMFAITLHNPYARKLNGQAYYVGIMPSNGGSYNGASVVPVSIGATDLPPGDTVVTVLQVPTSLTESGDIVLLRTRRADGQKSKLSDVRVLQGNNGMVQTTTNADARFGIDETVNNFDNLVCVDTVPVGLFKDAVGPYVRDMTEWKFASMGASFDAGGTGAVANPVALDNAPVNTGPAGDQYAGRANAGNRFPFHGFPRDGDMMTIPYVGHYMVYQGSIASSALLDAVPITEDVQQVAPAGTTSPQITGRFTPVAAGAPLSYANDWRSRIFDNFTTLQNPMNDFLPNMAPESWMRTQADANMQVQSPLPVMNNDPKVADFTSPVHGLININTADFEVLRMVPWATNTTSGTIDGMATTALSDTLTAKLNDDIARAILNYRRANGPFKSVMDILNVPGVPQVNATAVQGNFFATANPALPMSRYADGYHTFVRVSNLLTTRSDAFVIYVLVQQWQDYGTNKPTLVPGSEKRMAAIIDRSQLRDGFVDVSKWITTQAVGTD